MGKKFMLFLAVGFCVAGIIMEYEAAATFLILLFGFLPEFAKTDIYKDNCNSKAYAVIFVVIVAAVSVVCGIIDNRVVQAMILVASTCLYAGVLIGRKDEE